MNTMNNLNREPADAGSSCRLCPRKCGADRTRQSGRCRSGVLPRVARAALHMWEEPCISGKEGSGAIFFSGCPLGCVYCQNRQIALGNRGEEVTCEELAGMMLNLQGQGANNINLVTAGHFLPAVICSLQMAKEQGLSIPVVYNSGGYELPEALERLRGLVKVFLPDFKYLSPELAARFSGAPDYPAAAEAALKKMVELAGPPSFDARGIIQSGVIVRHLVLPGHTKEAKEVIRFLHETWGDRIFISILHQYTPMPGIEKDFPELGRRVTEREYEKVVDYALSIGVTNGFIQSGKTAKESFIPEFDGTGVG